VNDTIIEYMWADFCSHSIALPHLTVVLCEPEMANVDLQNADQLKGKIAVVKRGGNTYVQKAKRIIASGALGLIIVNTEDKLDKPGGSDDFFAEIPVVMIRSTDVDALFSFGTSSCLKGAEDKILSRKDLCLQLFKVANTVWTVDYTGKGMFTGNDKTRTGKRLELVLPGPRNDRFESIDLKLWKEYGGAERSTKIHSEVQNCRFSRIGETDVEVWDQGKATRICFSNPSIRNQFFNVVTALQKALVDGQEVNNTDKFVVISPNQVDLILSFGPTQFLFFRNSFKIYRNQQQGDDRPFLLANKPLDATTGYFEVLVRNYPCVAVGLCSDARKKRHGMPGWFNGEIGYHGDDGHIFQGGGGQEGTGTPSSKPFSIADRVGCGLTFKSGKPECVYFVLNGKVVAIKPFRGEIYPIVACSYVETKWPKDRFCDAIPRVDILFGNDVQNLPDAAVDTFRRRITVQDMDGTKKKYFAELSDAMRHAAPGQLISLSPGNYMVTETISIDTDVKITGAGNATKVCAAAKCGKFMFQLKNLSSRPTTVVNTGGVFATFSMMTLTGNSDCTIFSHEIANLTLRIEHCQLEEGACGISCTNMSKLILHDSIVVGNHARQPIIKTASGLKWHVDRNLNSSPQLRVEVANMQLTNPKLANEIWKKPGNKREFTQAEWDSFGIKDLHIDNWIRTDPTFIERVGSQLLNDHSGVFYLKPEILGTESHNCTGLYIAEGSQADVSRCTFRVHHKAIHVLGTTSRLTGTTSSIESCLGSCIYAAEHSKVKLENWFFSRSGIKIDTKRNTDTADSMCMSHGDFSRLRHTASLGATAGVTATGGAATNLKGCQFVDCCGSALLAASEGTIVHEDSNFEGNASFKETRVQAGGRIFKPCELG